MPKHVLTPALPPGGPPPDCVPPVPVRETAGPPEEDAFDFGATPPPDPDATGDFPKNVYSPPKPAAPADDPSLEDPARVE